MSSLIQKIRPYNAYEVFQPETYQYLHTPKNWQAIEDGTYQAGPYTIPYVRRGKKGALPAMDLPGGPASPLSSSYKEYFARNMVDITLADWRGAGLSSNLGGTEENRTDLLIEDIETLRKQSGYDKILLRGGSWGATIALQYAHLYPERVSGLVLGLPLLARKADVEWNIGGKGAAVKYPAAYARFMQNAGQKTPQEVVATYAQQLADPDPVIYTKAFVEWKKWEWAKCGESFEMAADELDVTNKRFQTDLARAKIMAYYTANNFFFSEKGVIPALRTVHSKNIPTIVVTNEYDALSNPDALDVMKRNLPKSEFLVNEGADWHWIFDPKTDAKGRTNDFVENGYAYATEKLRCMLTGQDLSLNQICQEKIQEKIQGKPKEKLYVV